MKSLAPLSGQRTLPLHLAQRTVFVTTETVRAQLGCDAETVFSKVDNGEFRWVFDVSIEGGAHGTARELRFWLGEIIAPEPTAKQTTRQVITAILGGTSATSPAIRRGEIERQWIVSSQHVMRLIRAGHLFFALDTVQISTASIEKFLSLRLIGAGQPAARKI